MSLPRFIYNGKTIDLDSDIGALQSDIIVNALRQSAASGVRKVDVVSTDIVTALSVNGFPIDGSSEALRRKLEDLAAWAATGRPWTFARDAGKSVLTTLTLAVVAGTKIITLDDTTGLSEGDQCVIRSKSRAEVVSIDTVDSGTQVTLEENLDFSYPNASRFRHKEYWQGRMLSSRNPVQNASNTEWRFDLTFCEDVNGLG